MFEFSEQVSALPGGAAQVTIEKRLPLDAATFKPGDYTLKIKILDKKRNQTLNETASFKVI